MPSFTSTLHQLVETSRSKTHQAIFYHYLWWRCF